MEFCPWFLLIFSVKHCSRYIDSCYPKTRYYILDEARPERDIGTILQIRNQNVIAQGTESLIERIELSMIYFLIDLVFLSNLTDTTIVITLLLSLYLCVRSFSLWWFMSLFCKQNKFIS